ncbi:MAG: hypothetical protein IKP88_17940 [Lachnospiraceae bacterium]|nr:hypothetical protein [Lachnospiraceae bacterium]
MLKLQIWKRDFELKVVYDCYSGEKASTTQKDSAKQFSSEANSAIDESLKEVEKYCLEMNKEDIGSSQIDNIFKYVMPESIFVKRDGRVAIMCRYKFDSEHGIAVVFKDNKFEQIGMQDIIL